MKFIILMALVCLFNVNANASSPQLTFSDDCLNAIQTHNNLATKVEDILKNVSQFNIDSNKGYSEKTAQLLLNATCLPFEKVEQQEKIDLCVSIKENVKINSINSNEGYSIGTAKLLIKMSGLNCSI